MSRKLDEHFTLNGLIVLGLLGARELSGREVLREAVARTSSSQATPGTVYPLLKDLVRLGHISPRQIDGKRAIFYAITPQGKEHLAIMASHWSQINQAVVELINDIPAVESLEAVPREQRLDVGATRIVQTADTA